MRRVLAGVLLLALVGGCDAHHDAHHDAVLRPTATATATSCAASGGYPTVAVTVTGSHPVVAYAAHYTLAPGVVVVSDDALERDQPFHVGLRVTSPAGVAVPWAATQQVAAGFGPKASAGPLADSVRGHVRVAGGAGRARSVLAYRGGPLITGRWQAPVCAGSTVVTYRGTFHVLGALRAGVARCGQAGGDALQRLAEHRACVS